VISAPYLQNDIFALAQRIPDVFYRLHGHDGQRQNGDPADGPDANRGAGFPVQILGDSYAGGNSLGQGSPTTIALPTTQGFTVIS
jgi:hypothetical protein